MNTGRRHCRSTPPPPSSECRHVPRPAICFTHGERRESFGRLLSVPTLRCVQVATVGRGRGTDLREWGGRGPRISPYMPCIVLHVELQVRSEWWLFGDRPTGRPQPGRDWASPDGTGFVASPRRLHGAKGVSLNNSHQSGTRPSRRLVITSSDDRKRRGFLLEPFKSLHFSPQRHGERAGGVKLNTLSRETPKRGGTSHRSEGFRASPAGGDQMGQDGPHTGPVAVRKSLPPGAPPRRRPWDCPTSAFSFPAQHHRRGS